MTDRERARAFRDLHRIEPRQAFVLPNAWDALSARIMQEAGAAAIGTTSAGVSWALGVPDRQRATREAMVAAIRRIAAAADVPVTADIESGYGNGSPDDVAETVRAVMDAGVVGINIEDSADGGAEPLIPVAEHCERIAAARAAADAEGIDLFVNARVDSYLFEVGDPGQRLEATIARGRAYVDAGADGVFVPGVLDAGIIRDLAGAIDAPLNILAGPGAPTAAELGELGVRRVSLGAGVALSVLSLIGRITHGLLTHGTFDHLGDALSFQMANGMFERVRTGRDG